MGEQDPLFERELKKMLARPKAMRDITLASLKHALAFLNGETTKGNPKVLEVFRTAEQHEPGVTEKVKAQMSLVIERLESAPTEPSPPE